MPKAKRLIVIPLLLLFIIACSAVVPSVDEPTPIPVVEIIPTPTGGKIPLTEDEVPRVTLEDAKTAFDNKIAIFVDVRSRDAYKAGHIPDAFLIQLGEFETRLDKIKLPKDQWIITYCT